MTKSLGVNSRGRAIRHTLTIEKARLLLSDIDILKPGTLGEARHVVNIPELRDLIPFTIIDATTSGLYTTLKLCTKTGPRVVSIARPVIRSTYLIDGTIEYELDASDDCFYEEYND